MEPAARLQNLRHDVGLPLYDVLGVVRNYMQTVPMRANGLRLQGAVQPYLEILRISFAACIQPASSSPVYSGP